MWYNTLAKLSRLYFYYLVFSPIILLDTSLSKPWRPKGRKQALLILVFHTFSSACHLKGIKITSVKRTSPMISCYFLTYLTAVYHLILLTILADTLGSYLKPSLVPNFLAESQFGSFLLNHVTRNDD